MSEHILPDVLQPHLKAVFCGMAAGKASAAASRYYAGPGNKFWGILYQMRLTPFQLQPHQFGSLPEYGIGLTDLVQNASGADQMIRPTLQDRASLCAKVVHYAPCVLAFNGKKASRFFLRRPVDYGLQAERIGDTRIWVLPSTSGSANGFWDESVWRDLAAFLVRCPDPEGMDRLSPGTEPEQI